MTGRARPSLLALRFGLVGLSGVVVNLASLRLFHGLLGWTLPLSIGLASEVSILSNFVANDRWTFGHREVSPRRLARFNLASVGGIAIAAGITIALAQTGWPYLLADLAGLGVAAGCNVAVSALWTWRGVTVPTTAANPSALAALAENAVDTTAARPTVGLAAAVMMKGNRVMSVLALTLRKVFSFVLALLGLVLLFWVLYTCPALVFLVLPGFWVAGKVAGLRLA